MVLHQPGNTNKQMKKPHRHQSSSIESQPTKPHWALSDTRLLLILNPWAPFSKLTVTNLQMLSQGLLTADFICSYFTEKNTSHQEWMFSTACPSTCTLVFHHLSYPQRMNVPVSLFLPKTTSLSMPALQTSAALSFLEPYSVSYSLFYL